MECQKQAHLKVCNCSYEPCSRKGICCECMSFHMHRIDGELQNSTHLLTDPALLPGGGNIAWAPGDAIQAVWSGATSYSGSFASAGQQWMGLTAYTNLTTGESTSLTRNSATPVDAPLFNPDWSSFSQIGFTAANAASWAAPFNTSSPTPPGIYTAPVNWGKYGCDYTVTYFGGC